MLNANFHHQTEYVENSTRFKNWLMRWHVICRKPKFSWRRRRMYFQNPRPLLQETIIWNKQFSSGYLPRHCFPHQPSQLGSFFVKYRKSLSKPRDSILSHSLQTWNRSTPVKRLFTIFRCGPRSDYSTPLSETYSTTTSGNIISYYQLLNTVVYTGNATRLISMFIQYLKLILTLMPALVMVVLVLSLMLSCQFWGHHHTI